MTCVVYAQPVPSATTDNPESEFINENFCYEVSFDLSGDPGYGPYLRIMVPPDFTVSSLQFLNVGLAYTKVGAFPVGGGQLFDPISEDSVGSADGGVVGDTLLVAELPVGSIVATTPVLTVSVCGSFNDAATIDSNYTFTVQPALEFGDTPTGDNGAIYGSAVTGQTKPSIVRFTKDNDAPEEERPPGESWPFTYTLSLDVANAKTLTNLSFEDELPGDLAWVGNLNISGGTGCSASYNAGTRAVSATCTSVTGTTSEGEIEITFDAYVSDILNENNCTKDEILNAAYFSADFGAITLTPDSARDTLEVEHLSVQTSASTSQVLPGDILTYTTVFQVTDYDSVALNPVSALSIQHLLPGGLSYDASITPTITLSGGTTLGATAITPVVDSLAGDVVRVTFDVEGTTGNINSGTYGTLTFRAVVRQSYDFAGTDPILSRDELEEVTTATYSLQGKASTCTDGSSPSVFVEAMSPNLTVENSPANGVCWVPRETVTFKLTLTVNSGDTEGIIFNNFFPLPIFDVSDLDTDNFGTGFDIRLASDHSDMSFVPLVSSITKDVSQNSLRIEWPDLSGPTTTKVLSVLVDLPIDYQPFDDGLYLSDIFQYQTTNSAGETVDSLLIRYLDICAPDVQLFMGVSATVGDGTLDPDPVENPVQSSLSDVDAGDTVTFELTVVNQGGAFAYDITLQDTTTEGLENCAFLSSDPLVYGDGSTVPTGLYSGDLFGAGLVIDSIWAAGDASKRDTIRIRYTCGLKSDLPPDTTLYNLGEGQWRSVPVSVEPDAELFPLVTDSISISSSRPTLALALSRISPNGSGNTTVAVPGDTLTYTLTVGLTEGETPNLVLIDTLPEGFAYVTGSVSVDDALFTGTVTGAPTVSSTGTGGVGSAQVVKFTFGNTTTTDNDDNSDNSFTVDFQVVALDNGANSGAGSLQDKTVEAELTYDNQAEPEITASEDISLGEPQATVDIIISPISGLDAGDLVTITLTVGNTGTTPLYDITLSDDLDGLGDFFDLTSVANTTVSMENWTFNQVGSVVSYTLIGVDSLGVSDSKSFTFTVELDDNVAPRSNYQTQAEVSGDSEPGAPSEQRSTTENDTDGLSTGDPSIGKALSSVSPDGSNGSNNTVTAGDTLVYTVTVTLTEGTTTDLTVTDSLPAGFSYSSVVVDNSGLGGTVSTSPSVSTSGNVNTGQTVDFLFSGSTVATGDNNASNNSFTLEIEVVVADNSANSAENSLQSKTNQVVLTSSSISSQDLNSTDEVEFAEPRVTINKWIDQDTLDAGDTLTVELRVRNRGTSMGHDIVAFDTLDSDLFDLNSVVLVDAHNFSYNYDNVEGVVTFNKDTLLASEGRIDLEFKVVVKNGVITGSAFTNVGRVTVSSQASTPPEERSRTRQNVENIYTSGIPSLALSLPSSTDLNTGIGETTIGEILTYQVAVTFPEGQTLENGVDPLLSDTLPIGFQYLQSPSHSAFIYAVADYNGGEITTTNAGTLNGTPVSITPTVSGTPATGQILGFDLGSVTNNDNLVTNDTDDEQIIITFEVLVLNTEDNNASESKDHIVSLQYQDGSGNPLSEQDTVILALHEPDLALSTTATPISGGAQGMGTITFNTVFSNQNSTYSSTLYDLSFSDDLAGRFLGVGAGANAPVLVSATYTGDGSDVSACFEWGGDGNELLFDAANVGCSLDSLNPRDSLILVYTAVLDSLAEFNQAVGNNAQGRGTTLSGASGNTSTGGYTAGTADTDEGERTGSGNNNSSAQAVNDLSATAEDSVVLNEPTLNKTGATNLTIGDSATMTLTLTIPGGTGQDFTITDNLPAGLRYTGDEVSITLPSGVYADTPTPSTSADDDPVVWNFGTLTNQNTSSATVTIEYEVEAQNLVGNQHGINLTNDAAISYTGSSNADSLSDDEILTVVEPNLTIEVEDGGGAYGAGSTIPYTIRIINADQGATAYGVDFTAIIPAELLGAAAPYYDNIIVANTSGSAVQTGTATAISGSDVSLGTSVNAGDQLSLAAFDLPADDTLTLTFESTVIANATAGGSFDVNATAAYHSLLDSDSRGRDDSTNPGTVDDDNDTDLNNYAESGSVTTMLTATVSILAELNGIHAANDFTVGDSVWYDFKVYLPEGVINNVEVVDSLPDGLGFLSAVRTGGANMSFSAAMTNDGVVGNAGKVTFDLSNITNTADADLSNDTLILTVKVVVLDDATHIVAGNTRDNLASVTSSVNTTAETSNAVTIDIVEPVLDLTLSSSNPNPSLNEEITWTVTIDNTGGAAAHDIDLAAVLRDLDLSYTGTYTANGSGFTIDTSDPDSLVFSADEVAAGASLSFSFTASVDQEARLDSTQNLTFGLVDAYDSQDGDPASPFVERNYNVSTSASFTPTLHVIEAQKVVAFTDGNSNDVLDIGETVTYTITLTNLTSNPATNVVFTDEVPASLTYTASSLSSTLGTVDASGAPELVVNVGSLAAGASAAITFEATVNSGVADGTLISNQGSVDSDQTEPEPSDVDGVDENGDQPTDILVGIPPALTQPLYSQSIVTWLTDSDASGSVNAGDVMRYTYLIENRGPNTLTGVSLTDALPLGLSLITAGTPSEGSLATGSYPSFSWTGITLEPGEIVSATIDVSIDAFAGADESYTSQGVANSNQTESVATDGNGIRMDGNQSTGFTAVNSASPTAGLDVEKRWQQIRDSDGDGQIDPSDSYRYTITIRNTGTATASDVQFTDAAPTNTVLSDDSVTTSQGSILTETSSSVVVNLGSIEPGKMATVSMTVTPSSASDGDLVANQAVVTSPDVNSGSAVSSDDNGLDADGINPTLTSIQTDGGDLDASDLTKTLVATSEGGSSGTNVLIGEVITYDLEIIIPKGYTFDASLLDTLPPGQRYVANSATLTRSFTTGLSAAQNPGSINAVGSGSVAPLLDGSDLSIEGDTVLTLWLGDIINSDDDAGDETYVLSYQAVVANEGGLGNDAGSSLSSNGYLAYVDGINQNQDLATPSEPSVTIQESNVSISQIASSDWILSAGGTIEYIITVSNANGGNVATAYDLVVNDTLPFDADEWESLSFESSSVSGNAGGVTNNSDLPAGRLSFSIDSIAPGASVDLVFRATANGSTSLTLEADSMNQSAYVTLTSLPGTQGSNNATPGNPGEADGERTSSGTYPDSDYVDSDEAVLEVRDLAIVESVLDVQASYTIGDTVLYQLAIAVPDGVNITNGVAEVALPEGISYISGSLADVGGNDYPATLLSTPNSEFTLSSSDPDTLTLTLGTISNGTGSPDTIVMTYYGRVDNELGNQYDPSLATGTELEDQGELQFSNPIHPDAAFDDQIKDSVMVEVGEPYLDFNYQVTGGTYLRGSTVDFQLTVSNTGNHPAYEVEIQDVATTYLESLSGLTVSATSGGAAGPSGFTSGATNWSSASFDLPVGASVTIDFSYEIASDAPYETEIDNTLSGSFSGQPGSGSAVERSASGGSNQDDNGTLNNYNLSEDPDNQLSVFPIELLEFSAVWQTQQQWNAQIIWETSSETNNDRFELYRSLDAENWELVNTTPGAGTTNERQLYGWIDQRIGLSLPNDRVFYQLRQIDIDGGTSYSNRIELLRTHREVEVLVMPNPFDDSFSIRTSENALIVQATIFDLAGKEIATLRPGYPQKYVTWSGLEYLAEGSYYLRISTDQGHTGTIKLRRY